jgi:peptidyl-tRNA hydrolase, PTH1 family
MKIIIGLGNPGDEYVLTRHNAGRIVLDVVRKAYEGEEWEHNKVHEALESEIKVGKEKVLLLEPETFMNKSGNSLRKLVKSAKAAKDIVVIYDDLDLPVGKMKISFNKSSGGHKGLESIIKQVKTLEFVRIRVGIDKGRNPEKHILGTFKDEEIKTLKKMGKKIAEALEVLVSEGWEKAASLYSNIEV